LRRQPVIDIEGEKPLLREGRGDPGIDFFVGADPSAAVEIDQNGQLVGMDGLGSEYVQALLGFGSIAQVGEQVQVPGETEIEHRATQPAEEIEERL